MHTTTIKINKHIVIVHVGNVHLIKLGGGYVLFYSENEMTQI